MKSLSRRTLLRGAGAALALPWLEVMSTQARAVADAGGIADGERPRRSIFCYWGLGVNGRDYTPTDEGLKYKTTKILKPLDRLRDDFTVISGLMLTHGGGHNGDRSFLTGTATHSASTKLRISCDQQLAAAVGKQTRFPSLTIGIRRGTGFGAPQDNTLSWTENGTPIPSENRPHVLFDQLFRAESAEQIAARRAESAETSSVLDAVRDEADKLNKKLGRDDRRKLDEYFTSVRDVEKRMADELAWLAKPKPQVERLKFGDDVQALDPEVSRGKTFDYRRYQRLMYDVLALALQTDSTRVVSYMPRMDLRDGTGCYTFMGCPYGYHEMTHHGEDPDKLKWNTQVDTWYSEDWAYFIDRLKSVKEGDGTLLDHTLLVWGSSGGTVNSHNRTDLPTMLVGGHKLGIRHQGHLVKKGVRLGNLWQTMFGAMGVPLPDDFQGGEADGVISELI
jgi:hypothetical protein